MAAADIDDLCQFFEAHHVKLRREWASAVTKLYYQQRVSNLRTSIIILYIFRYIYTIFYLQTQSATKFQFAWYQWTFSDLRHSAQSTIRQLDDDYIEPRFVLQV